MEKTRPSSDTTAPCTSPTPTPPALLAMSSLADLVVEDVHIALPASPSGCPKSTRPSFFPTSPNKGELPLRVLVGSWNVGNAMPPKSNELLGQWIPEGGGDFDVIAVGLQESSYREKSSSSTVLDGVPPFKSRGSRSASKAASAEDGDSEGDSDDDQEDDDGDEVDVDDDSVDDGDNTPDVVPSGSHVPVTKSRAKRSMRKVTKLMRQVSTNLRESVADALDYPFNRQLFLHLGDQYALVGKVELLEMRLFVYAHVKHPVSGVEKHTVATGLGSVLGNKGGLIFKMVVRNTSLCFVSCHLAAHQEQKFLEKRNADCASILGGSGVGVKTIQPDLQFDHCFWFGDLNYRVDLQHSAATCTSPERTHDEHFRDVLALVKAKKWAVLNANDQLRHQIQDEKTLTGWELVPALFPPTFKRQRDSEADFNPQRVPSYCDRVLHKSLPSLRTNLQCYSFQCVESISTSDHKPVVAHFQVLSTPRMTTLTDEENAASGPNQKSALSRTTTVEIRDLIAQDLLGMDLTGKSDPYIKFYSLPERMLQRDSSGSHPSTATIMNSLSPAWPDDQVPKLSLVCDCEADARRVHLVLLLMDYDATSMDDMLGNAIVPLDKLCHSSRPRFVPFSAPVVRHGKPAGTVSGRLRVLLPHQQGTAADDGGVAEVALRVTGCNCAIS